jgi:hypothetical protein
VRDHAEGGARLLLQPAQRLQGRRDRDLDSLAVPPVGEKAIAKELVNAAPPCSSIVCLHSASHRPVITGTSSGGSSFTKRVEPTMSATSNQHLVSRM